MKKVNIMVIEITPELHNRYYRHANSIATHLRKRDMDEITAALDCPPCDDAMASYNNSTRKWIIISIEGKLNVPVAIFGVCALEDETGVGVPWMVATNEVKHIGKFVMRNYDKYLDIMKGMFDVLVNYIDERNTESIKWLKRIGFTFEEATPIGSKDMPFHRFYMECE